MGDVIGEALQPLADRAAEAPAQLATERLVLRRWREDDVDAYAAINADPDVMRHFSTPLTREQTAGVIAGYEASFSRNGFGPWAAEVADTGEFIGLVGLLPVDFDAHFTPAVHLTVKLAAHTWRLHYGTEASHEVFRDGFDRLGLSEIVAFTPRLNEPSWRGMASLGMTHNPADDFAYPKLAEGHPLRDHVLYRIRNPRPGPR
ncbi:MAG TPA: GNAT family N-acetyltransferase [Aeromicrobium sp.]|nr:GNAT family N-acetyltransferase [Aeromicrobium sp.]